jgi:hypothetical protein
MTTSEPMVQGTVYLTVRRDPHKYRAIRAVKATTREPSALADVDDRVIKLHVKVPLSVFQPLDGGVIEVDAENFVQVQP